MKIPATDKQVQQAIDKLFVQNNRLQEERIRNVLHDWLRGNMEEWLIKNKAKAGKLIWASLQDIKQATPVMEEQLKLLINASMDMPDEELSLYCKITQIQKILGGAYMGVTMIIYEELKQVVRETKRQAG